jgi:membrane protein YqaA with SNARE-associated domain
VVLADVAGLVAGRVGYSYRKFFVATFLGKTLRFALVAVLGGRLLPPA